MSSGIIRVRRASLWTECLFHVLAHVNARTPAGPLASSCFDRVYIAWAVERMGDAAKRSLGEDVAILEKAATSHDVLAQAQALAWIFEQSSDEDAIARLSALEDRDLATWTDDDVDEPAGPTALAIALHASPLVEVLRVSTELEIHLFKEMIDKEPEIDLAAIALAIESILPAAPRLEDHRISVARALRLRGRILGRSILIGAPGIGGDDYDVDHLAWQAAHEATVTEVEGRRREGAAYSFVAIEREAIALLRTRARAAGLDAGHSRWLARLDVRALEPIP